MLEEIPATRAALPFPRIESWRVYRYVSNFFLLLLPLGPFVLSFFSPATSQSASILARLSLPPYASFCLLIVLPFYKTPEMCTPHFQPLIALVFEPPIFYVTTAIILFGLFFLANLEHAALYVFTHEVDIVDNRSNSVLCCPYNTLTLFHFYLMDATNFS